ncbi:post-transcriptional regulator MKT1L-like [Oppia nitens]|uniref:post-transcriptional regulator MKT1L-like n=1 Tax=Oppia nitens TaxID=1686743 RepID=UPI0023DC2A9C|nr:post-transcriptional regulator MKT1L-like [Oppia nitens]
MNQFLIGLVILPILVISTGITEAWYHHQQQQQGFDEPEHQSLGLHNHQHHYHHHRHEHYHYIVGPGGHRHHLRRHMRLGGGGGDDGSGFGRHRHYFDSGDRYRHLGGLGGIDNFAGRPNHGGGEPRHHFGGGGSEPRHHFGGGGGDGEPRHHFGGGDGELRHHFANGIGGSNHHISEEARHYYRYRRPRPLPPPPSWLSPRHPDYNGDGDDGMYCEHPPENYKFALSGSGKFRGKIDNELFADTWIGKHNSRSKGAGQWAGDAAAELELMPDLSNLFPTTPPPTPPPPPPTEPPPPPPPTPPQRPPLDEPGLKPDERWGVPDPVYEVPDSPPPKRHDPSSPDNPDPSKHHDIPDPNSKHDNNLDDPSKRDNHDPVKHDPSRHVYDVSTQNRLPLVVTPENYLLDPFSRHHKQYHQSDGSCEPGGDDDSGPPSQDGIANYGLQFLVKGGARGKFKSETKGQSDKGASLDNAMDFGGELGGETGFKFNFLD